MQWEARLGLNSKKRLISDMDGIMKKHNILIFFLTRNYIL
jgi:hypothetical protein